MGVAFLCAGDLLCFRGEVFYCGEREIRCIVCCYLAQNFTMSKLRVIKHGATDYLSPVDVEEFHAVVLVAGTWLASLLSVEYPGANLVSEALYDVTEVVEVYSLTGK